MTVVGDPAELGTVGAATTTGGASRRRPRVGIALGLSIAWLTTIALLAAFADLLPLHDYISAAGAPNRGPNWSRELLGTDSVGRSQLSRIVHGARVSFLIGFCATALSMLAGGALGLLAAYFGGAVNSVIDVLANTMLAIPALLFLLALSIALRPSVPMLIVILSVITVPAFMRITYANARAEMQRDYVVAARLMGASSARTMLREVLPNSIMPVVSYAVLVVPSMIVVEGSLSFLGYGVPAPRPSWGSMIAAGRARLTTNPAEALTPCAAMFLTVFALNHIGDAVRERYGSREGTS